MELDPRYLRPAEVEALQADPSRARSELGWRHKVGFKDLVAIMVDAEMAALAQRSTGTLKEIVAEGLS